MEFGVNGLGSMQGDTWELPSGRWIRAKAGSSYALAATCDGFAIPAALAQADAVRLAGARILAGRAFPLEFEFDPDSGQSLPSPATNLQDAWIPPFGGKGPDAARGLRMTGTPLSLVPSRTRNESDDPEHTLPLPPAGRYEFFGVPSASGSSRELIALAPEQGVAYLWLPSTGAWAALEQLDGGFLADSPLPHDAWRCELVHDQDGMPRIFLPTGNGIACLEPDLLRLGYHVRYVGDGACLGAPILWRDEVWAVIRLATGRVCLQAANISTANAGGTLELDEVVPDEMFSAPVCVRRQVVWPGQRGRIVLEIQANGSLAAQYRPWPEGVTPKFIFGSPYLSREGQLWQACWLDREEAHGYLRLDGKDAERRIASAPRTCTGHINYRLASRMKLPPWDEPEHGSDADARAIFVPILESTVDAAVLGVRIETTEGLEETVTSGERVRAILELQSDRHAEVRLFTLNVPSPWLGRAFVHDRKLWFYHPELRQIAGWELER